VEVGWVGIIISRLFSSSIFLKSLSDVTRVRWFSITWLAISRSVSDKVVPRESYFSFRFDRMLDVVVVVCRMLKLFRNSIRLFSFFGFLFFSPYRNSKWDMNGSWAGAGYMLESFFSSLIVF